MPATDTMIARLEDQFEEKQRSVEALIGLAEDGNRDLNDAEMSQLTELRSRLSAITNQLVPLREASRIAIDSRKRMNDIDVELRTARNGGGPVEYRSVGEYVADLWHSWQGDQASKQRLEVFNRVAAHQTTSDNAGLLPERILEPLVNRLDAVRPIVNAVGVTDLAGGAWAYAKVTQHTSVALQSAEKAELASQKMTITKTSLTPGTWGGYVNVSKQDINRTSPAILDMVIDDLAAQYAIATENSAADTLYAGATAGTNTAITAGTSTPEQITAALWVVAGQAFTGMQGAGRLVLAISPDLLGAFGPAFGPAVVTEGTAPASGFTIGGFGSGAVGQVSGIPVVVSAGMNANRALLINTAAVRFFEYRYGNMQVGEPSVWGVQVGYAGDFATVITDATGLIAVDTVA